MHERKDIIQNQKKFREEIIDWFKKEHKETKRNLYDIDESDETIKKAKNNLILRLKKVKKFEKEIEVFFIHEKNVFPRLYAWWNEENQETEIYKYIR